MTVVAVGGGGAGEQAWMTKARAKRMAEALCRRRDLTRSPSSTEGRTPGATGLLSFAQAGALAASGCPRPIVTSPSSAIADCKAAAYGPHDRRPGLGLAWQLMTSDDPRTADSPQVDDRIDRQLGDAPVEEERKPGIRRRPIPRGDTAAASSVQFALAILIVFFVLLALWITWPLLTGS